MAIAEQDIADAVPTPEPNGNTPQGNGSDLVLDSLEIKNFRAFRHLVVPKLGRVNLITGKNNVGKSALLEALLLYAERGAPSAIRTVIEARNELNDRVEGFADGLSFEEDIDAPEERSYSSSIKFLFHGRKNFLEGLQPITIGALSEFSKRIKLTVNLFEEVRAEKTNRQGTYWANILVTIPEEDREYADFGTLGLEISTDDGHESIHTLSDVLSRSPYVRGEPRGIKSRYIRWMGLSPSEVATLWDSAVVARSQQDIIASLRTVHDGIRSVNLIGGDASRAISSLRVPFVELAGTRNLSHKD